MGVWWPLRVSFVIAVLCLPAFICVPLHAGMVQAANVKGNIEGTWQGTLHAGKDLRTVVKIGKAQEGILKAQLYSLDQNVRPIPVTTTSFQNGELVLKIDTIDSVYTGKMSADGTTITGEWKQGDKPLSLTFVRATPETAWAIPEPPKSILPMAADVDPTWEVATIKPAPPDEKGFGFTGAPRQFKTINTTLNDLIMFAYDMNERQISGGQAWMETDKFDITTGQPDVPGSPSSEQLKSMLRKLLVERFALEFHEENKEMSAYVLAVAKDGLKMTKSEGDGHSFQFPKLGRLVMRGLTMDDICNGFQSAVFDRPVVNRTGIQGRYDGTLNWTPDESQFPVFVMKFGVKITPDESADAPPPIFTAIQQQVGLKLDAEKTAVKVMVLDHAEKPGNN